MNLEYIKQSLKDLEEIRGDDEIAHSVEDSMYQDFVEFISKGDFDKSELIEMAKELLKSQDINFSRWCA